MVLFSGFSDLLLGNFEYTQLIIWICVQFGLAVLFIYIAYRYHIKDNPYSIMKHTMSFLGSAIPERNPKGWYFFSIALGILSVMFFPLVLYYQKQIALISTWASWVGTFLNLIGIIGVFLVALVPDNEGNDFFADLKYGQVHNTVATVGFGGIGFGNIWFGLVFIYDSIWGNQTYSASKFLPPYIILFILIGVIAYTQIKWSNICRKDKTKSSFPGDGIYSFPLWEWTLTIYLFTSIYYVLLSF